MTTLWIVGGALLGTVGLLALWDRWALPLAVRWRAWRTERAVRDRLRRRSDELRKPRDPHRW